MVKLLRELVNIKSPFFEEAEIIDYLRGRLSYYNRLQTETLKVLLMTKLPAPRTSVNLIERPRLSEYMRDYQAKKITLVTKEDHRHGDQAQKKLV